MGTHQSMPIDASVWDFWKFDDAGPFSDEISRFPLTNTSTTQVAGQISFARNYSTGQKAASGSVDTSTLTMASGEWTAEAWVRSVAADTNYHYVFTLSDSAGNNEFMSLGIRLGTIFTEWVNGGFHEFRGATDIRDSLWHHIAVVKASLGGGSYQYTIYLDGIQDAQETATGTNVSTASSGIIYTFGQSGGSFGWPGDIDETRISNVARSGAEILLDYQLGAGLAVTAPGAPTGATAMAGNANATVSWTAPGDDGGSAITSYTVTSTPGSFTSTVSAPTLSAVVSGLTNGTAYTFAVTATNIAGTSSASSPSNSVTPLAPFVPVIVPPTPPITGFALSGVSQPDSSTLRVKFTKCPLLFSANGKHDALNISNYTLTGPGHVTVTSATVVNSDFKSVDLHLSTNLTAGNSWTLNVNNVQTASGLTLDS